MKHEGFRYEFTMKELRYFLFGDKKCPECRSLLNRQKRFHSVKGSVYDSKTEVSFSRAATVKQYEYAYKCEGCGREYTLTELSDMRR